MKEINYISKEDAERFMDSPDEYDLSKATGISVEASKLLSIYDKTLNLSGLTQISDEVAKALSLHCGWLILNGLINISETSAKNLSSHKGNVSLESLINIPDPVLLALVEHSQYLFYLGIDKCVSLTNTACRLMANSGGNLRLDKMRSIDEDNAGALSKCIGNVLSLNGLETISYEAACKLAEWRGYVSEASWGTHVRGGDLHLNGITEISSRVASAFSKLPIKSNLYLNGVKQISVDVSKSLSSFRGGLSMNGLTTISDEIISIISNRHKNKIILDGLSTLSEESATFLAGNCGPLSLNGLESISESVARRLSGNCANLSLNGLVELTEGSAYALSHHKGKVSLNGLKKLNKEAAEYLFRIQAHNISIQINMHGKIVPNARFSL